MRKNYSKHLLIIFSFLGLGMLASCNTDEIIPGPTISLVNPPAEEQSAGANVEYTVKAESTSNIEQITIVEKIGSNSSTVSGYPKTSGFQSKTSDLFVFSYTVPSTTETIELTFRVTDKNGKESSTTHTINVTATETNLDAATAFEWKRVGTADGTGLDVFGLAWTQNTSTSAVIKKGADKLVILTADDWTAITTKEALKAKVDAGTDAADYRGVSATAGATYNDVIATKKGDVYYMINITKATVTTSGSTTITITGNSKK